MGEKDKVLEAPGRLSTMQLPTSPEAVLSELGKGEDGEVVRPSL